MTSWDGETLVEQHYDRIVRLAQVMCGNAQDAQDLTQETFLAAIQGLDRFRGESTVETWLIGILRRQFLVQCRRRRSLPLMGEGPAAPSEEDDAPPPPDLAAAIARLPEPLRLTLTLFHDQGLDYAAIATVLDCPIGTVRSRLHEARSRLRTYLEAMTSEDRS